MNLYKITGLSHSGIKQISFTRPSGTTGGGSSGGGGGSSGGGGGGGGGGGAGAFYVCNNDWQCTSWTTCSNGRQTRSCTFVKVAQHTQNSQCPEASKRPLNSRTCEVSKKVTTNETDETQSRESKILESKLEEPLEFEDQEQTGFNAITGAVTSLLGNPKAVQGLKNGAVVIVFAVFAILGYQFIFKTSGKDILVKKYKNIADKLQKIIRRKDKE